MDKPLPLEERSIYQIYLDGREPVKYVIPIYQRNYAWEEDQISALIKDVCDSMHKNPKAPYYIGTLVTYKRGENQYEVIDGQQRLTTIYIILRALGVKDICNKLTYSARRASASTVGRLENYPHLGEEVDSGIRDGYKYALKALKASVSEAEKKEFIDYFLHHVHIIHYCVPKDVDLNHYFEVMNSRGEQLEKHEIVKSRLSQSLRKDERATFCRVWEACSEMNVYIQQSFSEQYIFGFSLNKFQIHGFDEIPYQDDSQGKQSIIQLLENPVSGIETASAGEEIDKFQPIIDFPNFLLIVLKLTRMQYGNFEPTEFILDDKELVDEFEDAIKSVKDQGEFARRFAFNLLKAKFLLDNYIVHHAMSDKERAGDNPWKLQTFFQENNKKKKCYPKNLSSTLDIQKEMVHILSMLEVSFTPKQRKNYLLYCLMYLFDNFEKGEADYLDFLQYIADKYFYDVYLNRESLNERNQPRPNAFDNAMLRGCHLNYDYLSYDTDYRQEFAEIYKQGSMDIPLYVFNYTDYMLWKKYADELRGEKAKSGSKVRKAFFDELGCSDFDLDTFNNFYFSRTRKSLEHYYPQSKAGDDNLLTADDINCFGNFAMIGAEANSSGSNWDPRQKLDHYSDSKSDQVSVASLKFKIMMQKCRDNHKAILNRELHRPAGMEWNAADMLDHQSRMLSIVIK